MHIYPNCKHCGMSIEIRNPSGYCDHLYYPDYCKICSKDSVDIHIDKDNFNLEDER